ncbi:MULTISPECIES: hypothetical protein [unclassified Variovorax]|uniref:hypothetical protein n=1 Tax=unclassified Variovorax TaxID=663243 RepID=UPI003F47F98C
MSSAIFNASCKRCTSPLAESESTRHAGWVWQALTGVPLPARDAEATASKGIADAGLDDDDGLPWPDVEAVRASATAWPTGRRLLLGRVLDADFAGQLIEAELQGVA